MHTNVLSQIPSLSRTRQSLQSVRGGDHYALPLHPPARLDSCLFLLPAKGSPVHTSPHALIRRCAAHTTGQGTVTMTLVLSACPQRLSTCRAEMSIPGAVSIGHAPGSRLNPTAERTVPATCRGVPCPHRHLFLCCDSTLPPGSHCTSLATEDDERLVEKCFAGASAHVLSLTESQLLQTSSPSVGRLCTFLVTSFGT